jgi:hypothetical protein
MSAVCQSEVGRGPAVAYVGGYVLVGEHGSELVLGAISSSQAPEGTGVDVHSEEHNGEHARDLQQRGNWMRPNAK